MKTTLLTLLLLAASLAAQAKFVQEVELTDGTVLVGYIYRQQPGRFMVFHADRTRKDPGNRYHGHDKDYTLQWSEVKAIRRAASSDRQWCDDRVTLTNGTVYTGQIIEQTLGRSVTVKTNNGRSVTIKTSELRSMEKVASENGSDFWYDRQYTNRLRLTDNTVTDGLIVMQYRGLTTNDSYVELLNGRGTRTRIYLPDIKEYVILLE